jgi:1-aminocyclopropane-1-carboxylate deaminase
MAIILNEPYIQSLDASWYSPYAQQIDMLRLDVLHPVVSGNKWYKLKRNIQFAIEQGYKSILTFGGGYSNHLIAAAATAHHYGLESIGIVRGQYDILTPTLEECKDYNMHLEFVPHDEYKRKTDEEWLNEVLEKYGHPFLIPEGGANQQGREGTEEIAQYISEDYTHVCLSAGTGTTFIGLRNALDPTQKMLGYVPMKGGNYLQSEIIPFLKESHNTNWQLFDDYHFGGFGKQNDELIAFMNSFYQTNQIPLDIVYTGKMMHGIQQQLQQNIFPADAKILCIHTGGLQGNASIKSKLVY